MLKYYNIQKTGDSMDFYYKLKEMSDEEIEKYLSYEIYNLENISKENNCYGLIGYNIHFNPGEINILDKDKNPFIEEVKFHTGYVPKGTKVVFGCNTGDNGMAFNGGMYYVVDNEEYVYEFCKLIKEADVRSSEELLEFILIYLNDYFGENGNQTREEMFQLIMKADCTYYDSIKGHKLSDFKGKGNAVCTEYAITANNILTVFGFDSTIVLGQLKIGNDDVQDHAFNIVSYTDSEYNRIDMLVDFAESSNVYDFNYNKIGDVPYIIDLVDLDDDFAEKFYYKEEHLHFADYYFVYGDNTFLSLKTNNIRDYSVGSCKTPVKDVSNIKQK